MTATNTPTGNGLTDDGERFGRFVGQVVATWNADGRTMTLREPFTYIDPAGTEWHAPAGSTVDGASIPRIVWSLIGGPFEGKYREGSVVHDVACITRARPWEATHRAFYFAMRASGVAVVKAKIMFAAVHHFGPRWPIRVTTTSTRMVDGTPWLERVETDVPPAPRTLAERDFDDLRRRIEEQEQRALSITGEAGMSLDDIESYVPPPRSAL